MTCLTITKAGLIYTWVEEMRPFIKFLRKTLPAVVKYGIVYDSLLLEWVSEPDHFLENFSVAAEKRFLLFHFSDSSKAYGKNLQQWDRYRENFKFLIHISFEKLQSFTLEFLIAILYTSHYEQLVKCLGHEYPKTSQSRPSSCILTEEETQNTTFWWRVVSLWRLIENIFGHRVPHVWYISDVALFKNDDQDAKQSVSQRQWQEKLDVLQKMFSTMKVSVL